LSVDSVLRFAASRLRGHDLKSLGVCLSLTDLTLLDAHGLDDDSFAFLDTVPGLSSLLVTNCGCAWPPIGWLPRRGHQVQVH